MKTKTKVTKTGTCTFSALRPGAFALDDDSVLAEAMLVFLEMGCFSMAHCCIEVTETCLFKLVFCMKRDGERF